jgi:hypothetical protein
VQNQIFNIYAASETAFDNGTDVGFDETSSGNAK